MIDWTEDIRRAFIGEDGKARFSRVLFDQETKVLYFEHFGASVTEIWLEDNAERREDFGVHANNSVNNPHAVVLWDQDNTSEDTDE